MASVYTYNTFLSAWRINSVHIIHLVTGCHLLFQNIKCVHAISGLFLCSSYTVSYVGQWPALQVPDWFAITCCVEHYWSMHIKRMSFVYLSVSLAIIQRLCSAIFQHPTGLHHIYIILYMSVLDMHVRMLIVILNMLTITHTDMLDLQCPAGESANFGRGTIIRRSIFRPYKSSGYHH